MRESEITTENLRKWFKEKWVRFGPDGKIRGACARGSDSEGKPKCLPQAKAHALGKKGRKYAASKKRREDPNPERRGPAKNVATKKKSNESLNEAAQNFDNKFGVPLTPQGAQMFMKQPTDQRMKAFQAAKAAGYKYDNQTGVFTPPAALGTALRSAMQAAAAKPIKPTAQSAPIAQPATQPAPDRRMPPKLTSAERQAQWDKEAQERRQQALRTAASLSKPVAQPAVAKPAATTVGTQATPAQYKAAAASAVDTDDAEDLAYSNKILQQQAAAGDEKAKQALALRKQQGLAEDQAPMFTPESKCPHCGGKMFSEELMNEKKDACYYKVKSRYKVWPSAYASGALVKCRKKGAKNWGTKSEGVAEGTQPDYMAGHCHVMALALKKLHPDWKIRAHIGWDEDAEDDNDYRIDHVYIVAPDGSAYDCRGKFNDEKELVGPDETGGIETQFIDYGFDDIKNDVNRGELKKFTKDDIAKAVKFGQSHLKQGVSEEHHNETCPHCGGPMFSEMIMNEKKDACYYKVKSRYKVWPSAYASGALVKCRKKGAKNWGTGGKKSESVEEGNDREFYTGGSKGLPMPGTYEEENDMFKRHGTRRITAMTNEDFAIKDFTNSLAKFYQEKVKFNKKPVENYDQVAQQLIDKATDPKVKEQIIDIVEKGKKNPYLQGGIITTIGALLAGGILGLGSKYGMTPTQTNILLQAVLNTVIPTLVSRINGRDWKDTIKYTLASAGTGTGIATLTEKWSEKYKRSINCNNPKGFSQRAHCQGRKKK